MTTLRAIPIAAAIAATYGCYGPEQAARPRTPGQTQLVFVDHGVLMPHGLPYERAGLILAGTLVPVQMRRRESAEGVVFDLVAHGQVVEDEQYFNSADGFKLVAAGGERYEPPVPIVRYPFKPGEAWDWSGKLHCGARARTATGNVVVDRDNLNVPGGPFQTLRVTIDLRIDGGGPATADRKLVFWFAPGKGIVKREFGFCSTREPIPEDR